MRSSSIGAAGLLLAILSMPPSAAELLELPAEWQLGIDSQLSFELDGADLFLTTRTDGLPMLSAQVTTGESAALDMVSAGGQLSVRRSAGGGGVMPRLRIEVKLGPGRSVNVAGRDLTIQAENKLPAGKGGLGIRLAIEASRAKLTGVRISRLEATASTVTLAGAAGDLALDVRGGKIQLQDHEGRLEMKAGAALVAVIDHRGQIAADLDGGSLEIVGGDGTLTATAAGAELFFDSWHGPVEVRARDSVIEALGTEHRDRWQIEGPDLQVILDRVWGQVGLELEGGSLDASGLSAALQVSAEAARLDLAENSGSVTLDLQDGSEAAVIGVVGRLEVEVSDSQLEIDRVGQLKLSGSVADVTARGVEHLDSLELVDSQLALDLRSSRPTASLELRGAGYASVQMNEPCVVQLAAESAIDAQVDTSGCELRGSDEQFLPRDDRARFGTMPNRLTATVGPDVVLDVQGEP